MRNLCFLLIYFGGNALNAQNIWIGGIWHLKQGDWPKDSVIKINQRHQLSLGINKSVSLRFETMAANPTWQYRIKNAEDFAEWRDLGSDGVLQLPILSGGTYKVEVTASTTQPSYVLGLDIAKTFWQTSLFWLSGIIYILFILGIGIYFFSLYNLRQKLKVEEIRNKIAADLHDEIGSNLSSIAIFAELLRKKAPANLQDLLNKIKDSSTESVQLMQDTIWAIQAKNDDSDKMMAKMRSYALGILSAQNIALDFEISLTKQAFNLPMEQRKDFYLIFKEAINNAAKHSKATKVNVECLMLNGELRMTIADNGVGFDATQVHEGNGLSNFEERAVALEIQLNIDSAIGQGTRISLAIAM